MNIPIMPPNTRRISTARSASYLRGRALLVTLAVIGGLLLTGIVAGHYCTAHTVDPNDLAKLKVGMDLPTASKTIGIPLRPTARPDGTYFVAFRKHDRWCMVDLTFDSKHRITSIFHDH